MLVIDMKCMELAKIGDGDSGSRGGRVEVTVVVSLMRLGSLFYLMLSFELYVLWGIQ